MRTVTLGARTPEVDALIARRHALGQDHFDEVWKGEYHMSPVPNQRHGETVMRFAFALQHHAERAGLVFTDQFNLGGPDDYRVPDLGLHRQSREAVWVPTAALIVEVVSPDDESWLKFDHYAAHGVGEVVVADPASQTLSWFVLTADGSYESVARSALLAIDVADVATALGWSSTD